MDNASPLPLNLPRRGAPAPAVKGRRLRRISGMGISEIAHRGWQEASKWLERVAPDGQVHTEALLKKHAPELANPKAALRVIRESAPQRFFAGVADTRVPAALSDRLPDDCRQIVAAADTFAGHHFDLLGYRALWFGDPIDWRFDPVWARRSPLVHWSQLDPLDPNVVGDSKIVWELNRHQWLIRLAQAHALTGEERYAEECVRTIDAWLDANPPGLGINWASSLEVGYRLISWCWTLLLLRDSPALSGEWVKKVLAAIWLHATHVRRYLSYYFSPNTHLTGEALGLSYAGILFPEFRDAKRWRDLGTRILVSESQAQICTDGVQFEQSTCYHRYTAEIYLHYLLLAARNGMIVPRHLTERVQQMIDFLFAARQPDGSIPAIGDADGGCLLPLAERACNDARGVFALAATIFRRPDHAWAAGEIAPEVLWFAGVDGMRAFDAIPAAPPPNGASRIFPSGGYAVMRSGWEHDSHQLIVDVGPLGCPISGAHGHADLLSVQCAVFGEPCLVDSGTFCYTGENQWRDFFRSTAAHSALMVDGQSQSETTGPFSWRRRPRVRLRKWHSDPAFDFLDADHDAYHSLPDPVSHRRRVIFVKPHYWLLVDDLRGASTHQVDLSFQFAPLRVTLEAHPWARAETPGGGVLWISSFPAAPLQASLKCGDLEPIRGWISTDYGQRQPSPMLTYSSTVMLPWRIVTLLLPDPRGHTAPPAVRPIFDDKGLPAGLAFERPRRSVRFDDRAVLVKSE